MEKRTLTIEEMIAAGASWADISTRVKEMQREHETKKRAEEAAAKAEANKRKIAAAARERLVVAFADWGIAEGFVFEEGKEDFMEFIDEAIDNMLEDMRFMAVLKKVLEQR
ncbi:MAG: hypothetical protein IKU37_10685 [Candidatus Gastranaerophilales bacterium]|nr:hypothetical protein [Candidatus Gastranaerophilales bacterium]